MVNNYNSEELQYLQMMQDNISRMATNSANSKTWLVTIVAGFLAIGCSINKLNYWLLLAIIPILVFWYFDAYYLRLERALRNREQRFINIKRSKNVDDGQSEALTDILFDFRPYFLDEDNKKMNFKSTKCMFFNSSVYPVYCVMFVIVIVITGIINY